MKRISCFVILAMLMTVPAAAQEAGASKGKEAATGKTVVSEADKAAIRRAAFDYVDGYLAGSVERLQGALHPNLQKVTTRRLPDGSEMLDFNGAACNLVAYVGTGMSKKPAEERKVEVTVLDVYRNIATVKIDSADFIDYAHILKVNDEWKVINVLWTMRE